MNPREFIDVITSANMTLPAWEVTSLLALLSACLLFEFTKAGLIAAYIFVFRWGMMFFMSLPRAYFTAYLALGCLVAVLATIAFAPSSRLVRRR